MKWLGFLSRPSVPGCCERGRAPYVFITGSNGQLVRKSNVDVTAQRDPTTSYDGRQRVGACETRLSRTSQTAKRPRFDCANPVHSSLVRQRPAPQASFNEPCRTQDDYLGRQRWNSFWRHLPGSHG